MQHDLAIRRLKELGQRQGHVTLDQVKSVLPIDTMTPEELGRVAMQLEDAGVEVQLDEDLLRPRSSTREEVASPSRLLPVDSEPAPMPPAAPSPARAATSPPRDIRPEAGSAEPRAGRAPRAASTTVLVTILIAVVVAAILLYVLMR
ncbi:RNA polymerase sigma factor region1.1 domain-containing protein [Benzoatithermus flavus]|uniref:RNA polymerase sigma factor region1.1 domain-containing protein n=1 Tax=Benzoatithermus flavus TaxID=3108223 RepID=A0ABU8XRV5_9PROT